MRHGQSLEGLLIGDSTCRMGFWYRMESGASFSWGLVNVPGGSETVSWRNARVLNPITDGEWHAFWSAPFLVSGEQLQGHPVLVLFADGDAGSFEVRDVALFEDR